MHSHQGQYILYYINHQSINPLTSINQTIGINDNMIQQEKLPRRYRCLSQLPPDFDSFPSKRHRVIKRGTHTSTYQTCDSIRMSTELSHQNAGSPSTPTRNIVNGTPSTPSTTMVFLLEAPIINVAYPILNSQPISTNPFGSLGHSLGYNVQSILMASIPFSYGMPNFTSQFSNSTPVVGPHASIGIGGTTPPYTLFSFGGSQIPQTTPTMGGIPSFNTGSNTIAFGWSNQPSRQASSQVLSFTLTSSILIMTNTFGMTNPPLSSRFTPGVGQFHTLGNPQPGATPVGGIFYNPHHNIPTGMVPKQPLMNHPRGGSYNPIQGHGAYQNPGWAVIPQTQSFEGAWGQMSQPRLPFLFTLNFPDLYKLMNEPVCHDPTWPPIPTKLPSDIPKSEGKNGEDPVCLFEFP
jgi:hypothetical protein